MPGIIAVISGPSGVGKSTIIEQLIQDPLFALSVSATTRKARLDEVDGRDYFFLTQEEFERRVQEGDFVEYATVHEHSYGTLSSEISRLQTENKIVLLDVDIQGARSLRERENTIHVFITPPDMGTLISRLASRGTESEESRQLRLATAEKEMSEMSNYDHVVVNDNLDSAISDVRNILMDAQASGK